MAVYVLGDIQGCYDELQKLLELVQFSETDQLWFTGDLVNRGPKSLETLRFIKSLGNKAIAVLGNHDLHLLAISRLGKGINPEPSLEKLLNATDAEELLDWLQHRPLAHYDQSQNMLLIHAGLPPQWDLAQTLECAADVERLIQGQLCDSLFEQMYGDMPSTWSTKHSAYNRARFIINCFTRMRYCTPEGELDFKHKGPIGTQDSNLVPWFQVPNRATENINIVFGHWSTLQNTVFKNVYAIDSGCVWGGELTALNLDSREMVAINCKPYQPLS